MSRPRRLLPLLITCLLAGGLSAWALPLKDLGLEIKLGPKEAPLQLGPAKYQDAAKRALSFTRVDFLISNFALQRADGSWLETANWFAAMRPDQNRLRAKIDGVPIQKYTAVRFRLGVDPATDKSEPNQYPPDHPLHPTVNGLHWGMTTGYVFLALEGRWTQQNGALGGFSYHLAGNDNYLNIELPGAIDLATCGTLQIGFDPAMILSRIDIATLGDSTHSRGPDPRAEAVRQNVAPAFYLAGQLPELLQMATMGAQAQPATSVGTPYNLAISQRLPKVILPTDNPLTLEGVALGKRLFSDPQLSANGTQSCASCHASTHAFTDPLKRFSIGIDGKPGTRNSMPLFNLMWQSEFFWDGRAPTLREQALEPIQHPLEMHETLENVIHKLHKDPAYPAQFKAAFGSPEITTQHLGLAFEQFLSTIISQDSKFDQALRKEVTLTTEEQRGLQLFLTEYDPKRQLFGADCFHCHGGSLFTNSGFANNGLDADPLEPSRGAITKRPEDHGKFRVPSLRNIALTAPYMHDGRFTTLEEVVAHYDHGVKRSATLDPNLAKHPTTGLGLSAEDQRALVAFLKTLTDPQFQPAK